MSSGAFGGGKQNLATATIQCSTRIPERSLQSIAMATMTVISSTNPIGSIAFLPAAPVGVGVMDGVVVTLAGLEMGLVP